MFSDELHYVIKGNKLVRCTVDQIHQYRANVMTFIHPFERHNWLQRRQYVVQASNLPKSFGFLVNTDLV